MMMGLAGMMGGGGGDTNVEQSVNQSLNLQFNPVINAGSPNSDIQPDSPASFSTTQPVTQTQTPSKSFSLLPDSPMLPGLGNFQTSILTCLKPPRRECSGAGT